MTASVIFSTLFAVGWEPELRGWLTVIIGVVALCGSVYLLLGTNLGSRLGFLVALAGLFGWMALMGVVWWIYGIGLIGAAPTWQPSDPITVVNDATRLNQAGVIDNQVQVPAGGNQAAAAAAADKALQAEGWVRLPEADPGRGQAVAAAEEILVVAAGEFDSGQFIPLAVYDRGGERFPKIGDTFDFFAFWHTPHYAVVEVAPVVTQREEPGRAPTRPIIDDDQPRRYVVMVRDLGSLRQPAALITIFSTAVFLLLCWMMHRRERLLIANRALEPARE